MSTARHFVCIALCVAIPAVFSWTGCDRGAPSTADSQGTASSGPREPVSPETAASFYIGVASLDVEENERASTAFDELSRKLPEEPAVWANLGIVRLRLGDLDGAEEAFAAAAKLAPTNTQITVLQALVDERQGQFVPAIERLRSVPDPDIAALYQLAELLGRTGREDAAREQLPVFDRILERAPKNLVAQLGRARLLARAENESLLSDALDSFDGRTNWTAEAAEQLDLAKAATAAGNFRAAATHLAFLQNLSLAGPEYQAALRALGAGGGSVGIPVREFIEYPQPEKVVAPADLALHFEMVPDPALSAPPEMYLAMPLSSNRGATTLTLENGIFRVNGESYSLPAAPTPGGSRSFCAADLNGDFVQDLVWLTDKGLAIEMSNGRGLTAYQPSEEMRPIFGLGGHGVWTLDFEADGDLDLLVSHQGAAPRVLRNNGDLGTTSESRERGGFTLIEMAGFPELRDVCWADFDGDGDGDLGLLDINGRVLISWNNRAGSFTVPAPISESPALALAFGDVFAAGEMGLVVFEQTGIIRNLNFDRSKKAWVSRELANWTDSPTVATNNSNPRARVYLADLDNNGAVDVAASAEFSSVIWLNQGSGKVQRIDAAPALFVMSIVDTDNDGFLDLIGPTSSGAATAHARGTKGYHWQSIQTRTLANLADGRLNSFGIGGRVEIRAGQMLAVMPITSPRTHFGLGNQDRAGVARIVWPNGVAQVEFDLRADQEITAVQRLKGSCPWVFARAGGQFHFVKDFIWRSPLGMRINSQDTAGVDQTEDWILIPGELLTADDGNYEIRITAELWETHFFDHIRLMIVDHPSTFGVYVDERFVPAKQPKLEVVAAEPPKPFALAQDESGRDVLKTLAASDGQYVDGFPLGRFQGIGEDHWVEFRLPEDAPIDQPLALIGEGWIYPTDSSLNVAISQGDHPAPRGLALEENDSKLGWRAVSGDLGFPAGKNKTVVIPLPGESLRAGRRHFRLRTNLEIYWDRLGWAAARPDAEVKTLSAQTLTAELRHRGFSKLDPPERRKPDLPQYDRLSGSGLRWRDLEGYYTRFGEVQELLEQIDDRYVIMNAGDEIILRFAARAAPAAGWTRDFVLIGDGWVKDGDFNTAHSRTVRPLPFHAGREYGGPPQPLGADPIFQKNIEDWRRFHTRYVTPYAFERGLMNGARPRPEGETP